MEEADKKRLTSNRSFLVQNIEKWKDVVDKLMDYGILTEGMRQDIEAERTKDDKNRKLLEIVPRRGPKAFQAFLKALVASGNGFVAEKISPGSEQRYAEVMTSTEKGMTSPVEEVRPLPGIHLPGIQLPTTWPTEQDCKTDFVVRKCTNADILSWQSDQVYKMRTKPRGRVLLFNNFVSAEHSVKEGKERKVKLSRREGTDLDEKALRCLLDQLHFDIEVKKDRTAQNMRQDIEEEKQHPFHEAAECFILVILSHGSSDGIYGIDGQVLRKDEIKSCFNNKNFKSMSGKPKLFFIQACRGDTYDVGANVADNVADARGSFAKLKLNTPSGDAEPVDEADSMVEKTPSDADMFFANATTQEYVSFRNILYGSWFVQALVYIFRNYAYMEDINSLFTQVNLLVSEGRARGPDKQISVAVSEYQSTLRHKLFFFPGLTETVTHNPQN